MCKLNPNNENKGSPGSPAGTESTCNAGDPGSIPGLRRSPGEGRGYSPQYSWASVVAQMVKNTSATLETWVQSLGWEDPLEGGMAIHSSILAWRIPWTKEPGRPQSMGSQRVWNDWVTDTSSNFRSIHLSLELSNSLVWSSQRCICRFFYL